jgi:hypothetical protein
MRILVPILVLSVALLACQKDNDDNSFDFEGLYSGTFNRTGMDTSTVTIDFYQHTYTGDSDREKYPAICRGSFEPGATTIVFRDSCTWTADFDWSLILNGTYNLSQQGDNTVRIWRTNGTITDEYLLRKVVR